MLMKNAGSSPIKVKADLCEGKVSGELVTVSPGATVEIREGYAHPRASHTPGTRVPSTVENLGYPLVPADPEQHEEWLKVPAVEVSSAVPPLTPQQLMAQGMSPGVAAIVAAKADAEAKALEQEEADAKAKADAEAKAKLDAELEAIMEETPEAAAPTVPASEEATAVSNPQRGKSNKHK